MTKCKECKHSKAQHGKYECEECWCIVNHAFMGTDTTGVQPCHTFKK